MLLALAFFAAPPPAFVQAIDQRIGGTKLHVAQWWSDDLDGDKVPESIAMVCDDDSGTFFVQKGTKLFEAPKEIDGRNNCDADPQQRPPFESRNLGVIEDHVNVHHGGMTYSYALRGRALVMVHSESSGFDVTRDGQDGTDDTEDYDKLTWRRVHSPPKGRATSTTGPLVLAGHTPGRAAKLFGATTVTASSASPSQPTVLHIHADRALTVYDCSGADKCAPKKVAKGDSDVKLENVTEVKISAGKLTRELHVITFDGNGDYPPPATPW